ncbi:hypothetical protein psyc5s11_33570 [Clostridium gelidum]|uniref:DUF11 domain-containing protein n=1 Tax=Clostridium gelidum TaxID=704125 RepID=A0ABM7T5N7_9CLOT|nr:DUF11 domain-containing protein [Clostridium gelidum]BCZ47290.1 hypothetical protein psyc5s11_33570 [Clostridium gelidum]
MSTIINTAKINGSNTAAVTGNASITSINTAETTLSLTKVPDATTVLIGNNITYTITIQNTGTASATAVQFSDTLSPNLTYVSATSDNGSTLSYNSTTRLISGNLGTIATSATVVVTIVATVVG